ncbi:hypothetical protein GUITHDRAFT_75781 [Guillardia theta CCMP2712]|uniref:Kinesin light chain n=1 Tax=Guillardia theta (strain CCMP2712) TaxID=905079 RepID=L1IV82_GUITC|nr:hypothetical protein GUITHDRAFT_75781 [Guillardia theta CCMP2712]EKX40171.1 hypothetical protein GUITHDRAFT_75781 [Guillardia theta CCMP2712]|eukprot:XP_005827151.1 hypothetical protein GUITHDRAFT_75781 [Guillardia theta CCMP2712]
MQDNIGVVMMNLGDHAASLQYHVRALRLTVGKFGEKHVNVAAVQDKIGLVYRDMNDLENALKWHERAFQMRNEILGERDLGTATSKSAIADVYFQQGDFDKALSLYTEVLEIQEQVLSHDHLDVAATLHNIAIVLKNKDLDASWEKFEKSLGIIVGVYGYNHRSVSDTLSSMATIRFAQKNWESALDTFQQSLDIANNVLGKEHPDVASTLYGMGATYAKLGRSEEAEEKYRTVRGGGGRSYELRKPHFCRCRRRRFGR